MRKDKQKHFYVGAFIGLLAFVVFASDGETFCCPFKGLVFGVAIPTLIGVIKEIVYDKILGRGTPEFMDALFTFLGGFTSSFILYLLFNA